jgi:hypothetical protein
MQVRNPELKMGLVVCCELWVIAVLEQLYVNHHEDNIQSSSTRIPVFRSCRTSRCCVPSPTIPPWEFLIG